MKTKALLLVLVACMIVSALAGCSSSSYDYKLSDYIKLGTYKNIKIHESDIVSDLIDAYHSAVDDYETDDEQKVVEDTVYNSDTEGVENIFVEDGDTVNIDFEGKINGVKFDDGSGTAHDLEIGSGSFFPGFEDGLIGAMVGETWDVEATFPEDHRVEEYRGKTAIFTVKINYITRATYPEYNDANVKKYTDYETVAEFEEETRETSIKNLLWEELYSSSKVIKYPKKELTEYYESYVDSYTSTATALGITVEKYASYMGYTKVSDFFAYLAANAQKQVKQELILYSMLEAQPTLKLSDKQYEQKAYELWEEYCNEQGYEGSYKEFKKDYDRDAIERTLYYDIVIDYINSQCEIEDDVTKNGLVNNGHGTRYYINNVMQKGWQSIDLDGDGTPDKCYFDKYTGYLAVGGAYALPEDGGEDAKELFYEFTDKGILVGLYNGLYTSDAGILYYVDGVYQTGWQNIDGKEYYFDDTGYAAVGDVTVEKDGEEILGRFNENGVYQYKLIGWIDTDAGTRYYYKGEDGKFAYKTGEYKHTFEGTEYTLYFRGKDGYLAKPEKEGDLVDDTIYGKVFVAEYGKLYAFKQVKIEDERVVYAIIKELNGKYVLNYVIDDKDGKTNKQETYFFVEGEAQTGWRIIDGSTYYFSTEDGKMLTGEQTIDEKVYNFGDDGKLSEELSGLVKDGSGRLVYVENGEFKTGMVTVDESKYYFGADGLAVNGWIDADGDGNYDHYASEDYIIVVSTTATIDGESYVFDEDGRFTVSEGE